MGSKQRPALVQFDGPETVELERGLAIARERRAFELGRDMKAQRRARMPRCRGLGNVPVPRERAAIDADVARQRDHDAIGHRVDEGRALLDRAYRAAMDV